MKKRQRPSSHTRRIKTKKGRKKVKINRHIKKKVRSKARFVTLYTSRPNIKEGSPLAMFGTYSGREIMFLSAQKGIIKTSNLKQVKLEVKRFNKKYDTLLRVL